MRGVPFMLFRLFLTDVALQGHPEMLDQPVNVTSRTACAARCLSISLCQAFFFRKYLSDNKYLCTPAYRRFIQNLGYIFLESPGQDLYHVHGDKCVPEKGLYWYPYLQFCFMFRFEQVGYSTAKSACASTGYRLAVFNTALKYNLTRLRLLRFADLSGYRYFIGAERVVGQYRWTWLDGTEATGMDWGPGEPNSINENCVNLLPWLQFRMNDESCLTNLRFVCELPNP